MLSPKLVRNAEQSRGKGRKKDRSHRWEKKERICPAEPEGVVGEAEVRSPRFTGSGWLAFPALKGAYKHVQLELEFRPEAWDGILLLAGERDDLQGDFIALILHHGFIEFRFDCGSGVGTVRSTQTVRLNEWNTLTVYRHRWDAWIQLNQEKRVEGKSKYLDKFGILGVGNHQDKPTTVFVQHSVDVNDIRFSIPLVLNQSLTNHPNRNHRCNKVYMNELFLVTHPTVQYLDKFGILGVGNHQDKPTTIFVQHPVDISGIRFSIPLVLRRSSQFAWICDFYVDCSLAGKACIDGLGRKNVATDDKGVEDAGTKCYVTRHLWNSMERVADCSSRVVGVGNGDWLGGLFARITFREPLFVGGPGNTTGLERLPVRTGFKGCVRHLEANEHRYRFPLAPQGDAANGFDVEECTADRCSKVPCSHGGKCLTTGGDTAVCLCPLGYTGDLCETRVDLQVPSFNGSSYLRYPGLADTSLSWLELAVTLKPTAADGVILYNGHHSDATGDFVALYLSSGHVQFTFDLGTGPASLRSENPVRLGEWVEVRVSRTGRLASLEVEDDPPQEILAPGAFTQLSLPLNLYLGGAPSTDMYSPKMKTTASFVGCIQTVILNRREGLNSFNKIDKDGKSKNTSISAIYEIGLKAQIGILAEALGGVNVGNCGHACEARPCGDAECRPLRDRFTCRCRLGMPHPCPAPDDNTILDSSMAKLNAGMRYEKSVPSFSGSESYLHYNDADTMKRIISYRVDINMRFRASSSSGLLLWSGRQADPQEQRDENDDFLALGLDHGYLTLAYNLGSGEAVLRYNLTRLDDDLWHRIRAVRNEQWASLVVDSGTGVSASSPGQLRQLNTDTGLYVGGAPDIVRTTGGRYTKGVVGCISDLVLDSDFSVELSSPEQATNTHSCIP
ncbi:Pikachurin [Eufriesea mexicana]|uniref:Pikachurin n=1 Tax=Eufriesea mexicana TaxID=516756 RepID=A0A310SV91_9HYME|nr:Pikachurin [Eufriesea mexicana]